MAAVIAWFIVTKLGWVVSVSGMGGCDSMSIIILVHRTGFFRNLLFSAKNIPFENGFYFKSLDSWESEFMFQGQNRRKYSLQKQVFSKVWILGIRQIMFQG